jgi:integrase/recombinase XerD
MSAQLEAFIEYITIIKALSRASIEAYTNDLSHIEAFYKSPLIKIDEVKLLKYLAQFENKRTLNRKLSSANAFFDFCFQEFNSEQIKFKFSKVPSTLPKYLSFVADRQEQLDRFARLCSYPFSLCYGASDIGVSGHRAH